MAMVRKLARKSSSFADDAETEPHARNRYLYTTSPKLSAQEPPKKKTLGFTTHYCHPKEPLAPAVRERGVNTVCVIGAGVSGVVTARVLLDEGLDVTVLEKTESIGGVWAENYVGFGIQTPAALYQFPDEPLPDEWDFAAGGMIGTYINQYAQKHGVTDAVEFGCSVESIEASGSGYVVKYSQHGMPREQRFDLVVVAAGVYGKEEKFIPNWPGKDEFAGELLHASDYLSLTRSEGKAVVTVGYGKSAFDCAQISSKVAASSTLLFREAHWCVPRKILGLIPFEYATFSRLGSGILLPGYREQGPVEKLVHAVPGLLRGAWTLVGWIFALQFGLKPGFTYPEKGFIADFWGGHGILPHPDFFPLLHSGAIRGIKSEIVTVKPKSLVLADGKEVPCDVLVAATGYKPLRTYLPSAVHAARESDGLWLYRNMLLPSHPNLVFLNSETTTFTNITTASLQARWLAEMLAGNVALPSTEAMQADIEKTKSWKRATMPNAGSARSYMVQTHQTHYYDTLLKDMKASIRRKRGGTTVGRALREVFDPYRPRDYDTIVTGEFKYIPGEHVAGDQLPFLREGALCLAAACAAYFVAGVFKAGLSAKLGGGAWLLTLRTIL